MSEGPQKCQSCQTQVSTRCCLQCNCNVFCDQCCDQKHSEHSQISYASYYQLNQQTTSQLANSHNAIQYIQKINYIYKLQKSLSDELQGAQHSIHQYISQINFQSEKVKEAILNEIICKQNVEKAYEIVVCTKRSQAPVNM